LNGVDQVSCIRYIYELNNGYREIEEGSSESPVQENAGIENWRYLMAVTGWPSQLRWDQFQKLDSRPQGYTTDVWIKAEWKNPPGKKLKPVKDRKGWRLENVNLVVCLVNQHTWVVRGKESDKLLIHEQGHWDMAGLLVRELHQNLVALRARTPKELGELMRSANTRQERRYTQIDKLYDDETDHGKNTKQQTKWNNLIHSHRTGGSNLP
jgi:hypothetical protein